MHPEKHLSRFLNGICNFMHSKRLGTLESVVGSCLSHGQLSVTSLGRGVKRDALEKHRIKQADRLLSNENLLREMPIVYSSLASLVVGDAKRVVILVDWSNLDSNNRHFLLRASVALEGRSITVYEEVHTVKTKEKLCTHREFLLTLKQILPTGVLPIIVADAGFRVTWFKEVEKLGWDWVGRLRGEVKVKSSSEEHWFAARSLHSQATSRPLNLEPYQIAKSNSIGARLVLYKAKAKGRVTLTKFGKATTAKHITKPRKGNKEPWLLATSLSSKQWNAKKIVKLYSSRMQIEESFRDMKSVSLGTGLAQARTYKTNRMKILVMVATLANTFSWLMGRALENTKKIRAFQANSVADQRVLSYVFTGLRFFKQTRVQISYKDLLKAVKDLSMIATETCIT